MTEELSIEKCQSGDLSAFDDLYQLYIKQIHKFIYYKTHHTQIAEDLTADTFVKALNAIQSFDSQKASFKTWLYQIARNTVTDHYRTFHESSSIDDAWDLHTKDDIPKETDIQMRLENVREYLKTLKSEQREIILLRVWGGHSFAEIAEIVGKSEAACKMTFGRGVKKLRADLALLILLFYFL